MASVQKIILKKMIRYYGQTVQRKKRTRNVDGEDVYYSYSVEEPIRGHFSQITPTDEAMSGWGLSLNADYIGTFLPGTLVEEGDLLYITDGWYEVQNKITRRTGEKDDYIEVLLRLKE